MSTTDPLRCPQCRGLTRVFAKAKAVNPNTIRRSRRCTACRLRFQTEEAVIDRGERASGLLVGQRYAVLAPAARRAVRALLAALEEAVSPPDSISDDRPAHPRAALLAEAHP